MPEIIEVECKYCGSFIEMSKAVKINLDTGEYEYLCDNCALKFAKHPRNQPPEKLDSERDIS
jgi:DNA-directed RNA polymerase subunit RPC12/RpoP